jgi:hypothetical protein
MEHLPISIIENIFQDPVTTKNALIAYEKNPRIKRILQNILNKIENELTVRGKFLKTLEYGQEVFEPLEVYQEKLPEVWMETFIKTFENAKMIFDYYLKLNDFEKLVPLEEKYPEFELEIFEKIRNDQDLYLEASNHFNDDLLTFMIDFQYQWDTEHKIFTSEEIRQYVANRRGAWRKLGAYQMIEFYEKVMDTISKDQPIRPIFFSRIERNGQIKYIDRYQLFSKQRESYSPLDDLILKNENNPRVIQEQLESDIESDRRIIYEQGYGMFHPTLEEFMRLRPAGFEDLLNELDNEKIYVSEETMVVLIRYELDFDYIESEIESERFPHIYDYETLRYRDLLPPREKLDNFLLEESGLLEEDF